MLTWSTEEILGIDAASDAATADWAAASLLKASTSTPASTTALETTAAAVGAAEGALDGEDVGDELGLAHVHEGLLFVSHAPL